MGDKEQEGAALLSDDLARLRVGEPKGLEGEGGDGGDGGGGRDGGGGGGGDDAGSGDDWDNDDWDNEDNIPTFKSAEELAREKAAAAAEEAREKAAAAAAAKSSAPEWRSSARPVPTPASAPGPGGGGAQAVPGDGHHCLEIFDFDPSTTTIDLERFIKGLPTPEGVTPVLKWVDDTHALVVCPSAAAAALAARQPGGPRGGAFKLRSYAEASYAARQVPLDTLKPPAPRPKTNSSVARRLIGGALGMPSVVSLSRHLGIVLRAIFTGSSGPFSLIGGALGMPSVVSL